MNKRNNGNDDAYDAAILRDLRAMVDEQMKLLHNVPRGRERALKEADIMIRVMKRLAPGHMAGGNFDSAFAMYGRTRDEALANPFGGNDADVETEAFELTLGAAADVLHEDFRESRRNAWRQVSHMVGTDIATPKRVENWSKGGKEYKKPGRLVGAEVAIAQLRASIKRRCLSGDLSAAKTFLQEELRRLHKRSQEVEQARIALVGSVPL